MHVSINISVPAKTIANGCSVIVSYPISSSGLSLAVEVLQILHVCCHLQIQLLYCVNITKQVPVN